MTAPPESPPRTFRVATYNIHRCVGSDRRHDPDRVAAVIRELDVDAIGLQEVDGRYHAEEGLDQIEYLGRATGMAAVWGPTLQRRLRHQGNGLLTRRPIRAVRPIDLSVTGREPRGAIDVELDVDGEAVRILVAHFGLRDFERRSQADRLLDALGAGTPLRKTAALVVLGDFNEWAPRARSLRRLDRELGRSHRVRSFPARRPLFALDRIWVQPAERLVGVGPHRSSLARTASDHLPVRGTIAIPAPEPPRGG